MLKRAFNKEKTHLFIFLIVLLIGVVIKCYKFGIVFDVTGSDEMGSAYDAWSLLHYGVDRYKYSWPVYFANFGVHGQSALNTYLIMLSIKLLGYSKVSIRLPALIFSTIGTFFGALLTGELVSEKGEKYVRRAQICYLFLGGGSSIHIYGSQVCTRL